MHLKIFLSAIDRMTCASSNHFCLFVSEVAVSVAPTETRAVQEERKTHAELFQKIAEEHRLLAEEHKRLAHRQYYT